jgi:copper transport protein
MHGAAAFALWAAALGFPASVREADAPPLRAHAILERSVPAAGDTLSGSPAEVVLTFSGPIEVAGATLRLLGPNGLASSLQPRRSPGDSRTLGAALPALAAGGYRVEWRVVSADGHPIGGDFVFFVRGESGGGPPMEAPTPSTEAAGGPTPAADHSTGPSFLLVATRAGADLSLLPLAGLLLFAAVGGATTPLTDRSGRVLAVAAPLLAVGHAWLWAGEALGGSGGRLAGLLSLATGRALLAEAVLAALVPWALLLAQRIGLAAVIALVAVSVGGFGGHPASYTPLLTVPASVAHVVGASVWLGGLMLLVTERGSPSFEMTARRVSAAALIAVGVVAATGIVQTLAILGPPSRLIASTFGLVVIAKMVGLAALLAFGAHHRFRLLPAARARDGAERLSRSVARELALAGIVVVLAALLSHIPPTV